MNGFGKGAFPFPSECDKAGDVGEQGPREYPGYQGFGTLLIVFRTRETIW